MVTFPFGNGDSGKASALDVSTRIEVQEQMTDAIADSVAEIVRQRVDAQEAALKPVYRTVRRDIERRNGEVAVMVEPIDTRMRTAIHAANATTAAMLNHVAADAGVQLKPVNPGPPTAPTPAPVSPLPTPAPTPAPTPGVVGGDIPPPDAVRGCFPCTQSNGQPGFYTWIRGNDHSPCYPPEQVSACSGIFPPPISPPASPPPVPLPPASPPPALACPLPGTCPAPIINVSCPDKEPEKKPEEPGPATPEAPSGPPDVTRPNTVRLPPARIDWCVPDPCVQAIDATQSLTARLRSLNADNESRDEHPIRSALSYYVGVGTRGVLDFLKRVTPGDIGGNVAIGFGETVGRLGVGANSALALIEDLGFMGMRDISASVSLMAHIGAGNVAERESGIPISYMMTAESYLLQYNNPQFIPSQAEVDSAWIHGRITDRQWDCYTRAQGNIPDCRKPVLEAQARTLDVLELISLFRRGLLGSKADLIAHMRRVGVTTVGDVDKYLSATQQLPTPAELTHMAIRDAFDPEKLGRKEILDEFRQQRGMIELFEAQGYGNFTIRTVDGRTLNYNAAELVWLASYEEASPTQTYEMQHRLRPNRVHMFSQFIQGKRPDELRTILPGADLRPSPDGRGTIVTPRPHTLYETAKNLKEKDYNPIWRDKLAAISYRVIGRIDLRRLYRTGIFGPPVGVKGFIGNPTVGYTPKEPAEVELAERYMDEGYNRTDANALSYYTAWEWEQQSGNRVRTKTLNNICSAFKLGVMSEIDAVNETTKILGNHAESRMRIDQCKLEHRIAVVKQTISAIRAGFLRLEYDANEARRLLTVAGVDRVRIGELLEVWRIQLNKLDKDATTNQLCAWYNQGSITRVEYKKRLSRLGYSEADVDRIVRHCELGELARQAKVRERVAKATRREQQRIFSKAERDAREAQKAREREIAKFLSFRSEKNLKEWLLAGEITAGQVRDTFILKGVSPDDADRWLRVTLGKSSGQSDSGGKP